MFGLFISRTAPRGLKTKQDSQKFAAVPNNCLREGRNMKNSLAGFRGNQVFNSVALLALGIALWLATSSGAVAQPGTVTFR